ncbi:hypothetical protein F511_07189 [Dorcoceras hygrometricum]|uniref:Uncharacterized protein n=1 Tax=Dorcoceras hygrometricum TaxID=472368 RepID=A0A2Z7AWU8_9LAMI|nr:hypothetical protein F511_07189 [Dorcoceras hygrometricum]
MGIDQLGFQSVKLGYLKILQMGKAPGKSSVCDLQARQPSQLGGSDTTNLLITTPMIALDLSGTTHLSADHNVALSQVLNRSKAHYVCMNAMKLKSDFNHAQRTAQRLQPPQLCLLAGLKNNSKSCSGLKSVKAPQYSAQILASTTYCLWSRTQIWFYLSKQLLTARTKLKTAEITYPKCQATVLIT